MNNIPWSYRIFRWTWRGLDLLFPPECASCGKARTRWCSDCQKNVPRIAEPFCDKCGIPVHKPGWCDKCATDPPVYRTMRSWAVFDSPIQEVLHSIKYRKNIGVADELAIQMAAFVQSLNWPIDMITPAPLGRLRFKERGYNQVALVALPLAYELDVAYKPRALKKIRETRSQVGLTVSQRRENVSAAYQANPSIVKRKSILLMDDVATTGSTINACAGALMSAGAQSVFVITAARALAHHDLQRV